jgi:hypothetical protein
MKWEGVQSTQYVVATQSPGDIQFPIRCLLLTVMDVVDSTVMDSVGGGIVCIQEMVRETPLCGHR